MAQYITDKNTKSLDTPHFGQKIYFDGGAKRIKGFGVRVTAPSKRSPEGVKSFILDYWTGGAQRRYTIGRYPTWTVEAARKRAAEVRRGLDKGIDPLEARQSARKAPTVKDLATRYREEHLPGKALASQNTDNRIIAVDILPDLGRRKVAQLHLGDAKGLHKRITDRGAPVHANRVLALLSKMFSLSLVPMEGETEPWRTPVMGNPCTHVTRNLEEGRERYFSEAELDRIAGALSEYPGKHVANLLRFVMLTGCRPSEGIGATWDQMEADTWIKPAANTKTRKTQRLPLSPAAIELVQQARTEVPEDCRFVFPGRKRRGKDWEPIAQYRSAWAWIRDKAELESDAEGRAARVYDLRHSFASVGAGQGLSLFIIGRLLGHTQFRTTQRYAHLADDPLRQAAEKISGAIANAGKASKNVVSLKGGRGS
jgi:integrase